MAALLLAALAGALVALAAARLLVLPRPPPSQADVLARVDGQPITLAAFSYEMERRGGGAAAFSDLGRRRALVEEMVRTEVLAANARRAGYADAPDFGREVTSLLASRYRQRHIEPALAEVRVSDDEVRAAYEADQRRFAVPEARRAAVIWFEYARTAAAERKREVAQRAESVRAEAAAQDPHGDFGVLALRHSDDQASRYRGGDIGWQVKGSAEDNRFDAAVIDAILSLPEPGALSPLIETPQGLYLVRLLETKPESVRALAQVADSIRRQLLAEKRERRLDELLAEARRGVPVEIDETRLAAMAMPTPAATAAPKRPPDLPQG